MLSGIPEVYYDFLAMFVPGFVTVALVAYSPTVYRALQVSTFLKDSSLDRALFFSITGYAIGHVLTLLSDLIIRRPTWYLLGKSYERLLDRQDKRHLKSVRYPKSFAPEYIHKIESAVNRVFQNAGNDLRAHSFLDLCEQFVKKKDPSAGMLCQKRHGLVVMCRNMVISMLICCSFYLKSGLFLAIVFLLLSAVFFLRWNYLRIRRSEFLLHSFYLCSLEEKNPLDQG